MKRKIYVLLFLICLFLLLTIFVLSHENITPLYLSGNNPDFSRAKDFSPQFPIVDENILTYQGNGNFDLNLTAMYTNSSLLPSEVTFRVGTSVELRAKSGTALLLSWQNNESLRYLPNSETEWLVNGTMSSETHAITFYQQKLVNVTTAVFGSPFSTSNYPFVNSSQLGSPNGYDGVFNGSSFVSINDSPSLDISGPLTIQLWIYPFSVDAQQMVVEKAGGSGTSVQYMIQVDDISKGEITFSASDGTTWYHVTHNITPNSWHFVSATMTSGLLALSVDGNLSLATGPERLVTTTYPVGIGAFDQFNEYFCHCIIAWVQLYNSSLNSMDVLSQYNAGIGDPMSFAGLKAFWAFDQASGSEVDDLGPYGNLGIIHGPSIWKEASNYPLRGNKTGIWVDTGGKVSFSQTSSDSSNTTRWATNTTQLPSDEARMSIEYYEQLKSMISVVSLKGSALPQGSIVGRYTSFGEPTSIAISGSYSVIWSDVNSTILIGSTVNDSSGLVRWQSMKGEEVGQPMMNSTFEVSYVEQSKVYITSYRGFEGLNYLSLEHGYTVSNADANSSIWVDVEAELSVMTAQYVANLTVTNSTHYLLVNPQGTRFVFLSSYPLETFRWSDFELNFSGIGSAEIYVGSFGLPYVISPNNYSYEYSTQTLWLNCLCPVSVALINSTIHQIKVATFNANKPEPLLISFNFTGNPQIIQRIIPLEIHIISLSPDFLITDSSIQLKNPQENISITVRSFANERGNYFVPLEFSFILKNFTAQQVAIVEASVVAELFPVSFAIISVVITLTSIIVWFIVWSRRS